MGRGVDTGLSGARKWGFWRWKCAQNGKELNTYHRGTEARVSRKAQMFEKTSDRHAWKRPLLRAAAHSHSETQNSQKIMRDISMNPVNIRIVLCATCFLCLHPGSTALMGVTSDANATCTDVINTRVVSGLSIDEISKLGDPLSLQNDFGGLILRPFDDDDRPRRGKEIEIGFILARSGDLGGTPVGLTIWSERNLKFNFRKSPRGAIVVESSDLNNCHVLASFTLSEKGYVLRDNKAIAQAH
jgi:hypothetical protein